MEDDGHLVAVIISLYRFSRFHVGGGIVSSCRLKKKNRWTWLETCKLAPVEEHTSTAEPRRDPPPFVDQRRILLQDFEYAPSWDFASDQIPRWYDEREDLRC